MYLTEFAYAAPTELSEVIRHCGDDSHDVKLMAGGQSLIPLLKLKIADPTFIVDLRRVADLRAPARLEGNNLVLPAMTSYARLLGDPLITAHAPLLCAAVRTVGDRQVRRLGTIGGACSHADPAGDAPAVLVALRAVFVIEGPDGRRKVPADEFFFGFLETALGPQDVLVEILVPSTAGWRASYQKAQQNAQAWATAAVGATIQTDGDVIKRARLGMCNLGMTPLSAEAAERELVGNVPAPNVIAAVATIAAESTAPTSDAFASAEYRSHLAKVLAARAIKGALI